MSQSSCLSQTNVYSFGKFITQKQANSGCRFTTPQCQNCFTDLQEVWNGKIIIKNKSNSTKLKLPEGDIHELIKANTGKTNLVISHKTLRQTCPLFRLKTNGQDQQENCSFHS